MTRHAPITLTFALCVVLIASTTACKDDSKEGSGPPQVITETGFLSACGDTSECDGELECICGYCTRVCDDTEPCGDKGTCTVELAASTCLEGLAACLPECSADSECAGEGSCQDGTCIAAELVRPQGPTTGLSCDQVDCDDRDACTTDACVDMPLKVVFVLDESSSLQCTDSQNGRHEALDVALEALVPLSATSFAVVGFSSKIRTMGFGRDKAGLLEFAGPSAALGPATDYQGALTGALELIEADLSALDAAEAARTRYQVIMMTDGVPEPRCLAGCEDTVAACGDGVDNDGDGVNDSSDPDCANIDDNTLHPDNLYGICNADLSTLDPPLADDQYIAFEGQCPEYNTDAMILAAVDAIVTLQETHGSGEIKLDTFLIHGPPDIVDSVCPGASELFGLDRATATTLLTAMAEAGNGSFVDIDIAAPNPGFVPADMTDELVTCENTPVDGTCP